MTGLLAYPIPNLINGVSQQSPQQRRDTQLEAQVNCINSPVEGCVARPGTKHVTLLPGEDFRSRHIVDVYRSDEEKYRIVSGRGTIRVFDLITGEEGTVTIAPGSLAYLQSVRPPIETHRSLTIEDSTFILNREKKPAMIAVAPPSPTQKFYEAFIYFRAGDYLSTYTVFVYDPVTATEYRYYISTPDNSNAAHAAQVRTTRMAANMFTQLTTNGGGPLNTTPPSGGGATSSGGSQVNTPPNPAPASTALQNLGFSVSRLGNIIRIRRFEADGGDFTITGYDDANGDRMLCIKEKVQRFAQLPNIMWEGTVLQVKSAADDNKKAYYVEFEGHSTSGVWVETTKPWIETEINPATMPHVLKSLGNNEFTFGPVVWANRIAGDGKDTAKDPGFIGVTVKDMLLHRDRFGLLHEAGVVFSKVSQYETFFPDTVQTELENGPIDVHVASSQIAVLEHAVSHMEQLFLWSNRVQFAVTASERLTAATIEAKPSTTFTYNIAREPVGLGDNIVFVANNGTWSQVFEQMATVQGISKDAQEITAHVPKYVPAGVRWVAGSTSLKMHLFGAQDENRHRIYVYSYFLVGEEKQQSAWSMWEFPRGHNIIHGSVDGVTLNLLIRRPDGMVFETLDLSPAQTDPGGYYLTRLDRRITEADVTQEYVPPVLEDQGHTLIGLPYRIIKATELDKTVVITRAGGTIIEGEQFTVEDIIIGAPTPEFPSGQCFVKVKGAIEAGTKFYVGMVPVATAELSPFYPKDERGSFLFERTQVRAIQVAYDRTGWTKAKVIRKSGEVKTLEFAGRVLGSPTNTLDSVAISKGTFSVPVKSKSDNYRFILINDSPLPSSWQSAEVHYRPTVRASRR